MAHPGFAFINVISPCVTFNNNVGSTKSYDYVRQHVEATGTIDFVPQMDEITADYSAGTIHGIRMHDGSVLQLHKLAQDWDPENRISAINAVKNANEKHEILTGLLFIDPKTKDLHELIKTSETPLNKLGKDVLCPGSEALKAINAGLR
jgi:2-oxoglutarate/2-oxoacid ferredoxin oxidoreductase subunit beta